MELKRLKHKFGEEIDNQGFAEISQVLKSAEIAHLCASLANLDNSAEVKRRAGTKFGVRNLMNLVPEVRTLANADEVKSYVEMVLGKNAKPVRAIYFDKVLGANWKVPWHQDLTVAVKERHETIGFSAWSKKANVLHVQPTVEFLENMIALRIHLDDSDETNGALKVFPESHKLGRLNSDSIQKLSEANEFTFCRIKRGDALLMRPLLVHSSSAGTMPKHRRVIHIEYSAQDLPNGLQWYGS